MMTPFSPRRDKVPLDKKTRINHQIQAPELRIIDDEEGNLGVMTLADAMKAAVDRGLDLIEISPDAKPPVAKIMDFGKYQYQTEKKARASKAKSKVTETKALQITIGTGDHDLMLKADQASRFLKEGHRVKIDLFLPGRSKYLDPKFLHDRLARVLTFVAEEYKIADPIKKSPKGLSVVLEKLKAKN